MLTYDDNWDDTVYDLTVTFGAALKNSQSYYVEVQSGTFVNADELPLIAKEGVTFTTVAAADIELVSIGDITGTAKVGEILTAGAHRRRGSGSGGSGYRPRHQE